MALDQISWNQHALANKLQTLILLILMGCLMLLVGYLLWGVEGVIILTAVGLFLILLNPRLAPQLIMKMYGATPLLPSQAPFIHSVIKELSRRAGLQKTPSIHYIPSSTLNAFSVGHPRNAIIGLTDGIIRALTAEELCAVLAHEISHVRNNDMGVMGLADLFSRLTRLMSLFGQILLLINLPLILMTDLTVNWFAIALLIFSPNVCALAQLGLSRTREYDADLNAARLTGDPDSLARALVKIERTEGGWLETIFFPGRRQPEPSLLRTHPPTEQRVQRLMALKLPERIPTLNELLNSDVLHQLLKREVVQRRPRRHFTGLWH